MALKWLFFDLDDTLYDFTQSSLVSLRKLWDEEELIKTKYDDPESFIGEYHKHNALMWERHERGEITAEYLKMERFRLTLAPDKHDEDTETAMRGLNRRYLEHLGESDLTCPGAQELLASLRGKYMMGILTNGFTEVQYNKLRSTGLWRHIQRMVISDEIGIQKPDPRLFHFAEEAVGAKADEIMMIGDNPDNDVEGALQAGWRAVYYDRKMRGERAFDSKGFQGRITDLRKLNEILRAQN